MASIMVTVDGHDALVATAKLFASGRRGFFAGGKLILDGQQYQCTMSVVKTGDPTTADVAQANTDAKVKAAKLAAKANKARK